MTKWERRQLGAGIAGVVGIVAGEALGLSLLSYLGMATIGLVLGLMGLEAMVEGQIRMPSRYNRYQMETYVGAPAFYQGVLLIVMGAFLVGVSYLAWSRGGDEAIRHFIRRPGPVLAFFGAVLAASAVVAGGGTVEDREGPRWEVILTLLTSRLLPAAILTVLAIGATALGFFEMIAPERFDAMGGGFLEVLLDGPPAGPEADPPR